MYTTHFYLGKDGVIHNERVDWYVKMLSVSRVRDRSTGIERLAVELYDNYTDDAPYATSYCSLIDMHGDIVKLREYGFIAPRKETLRMARTIEEKYYELECTVVDGARTLDTDMPDILRFICRYILDNGIDARAINGNTVYSIPVTDFRTLFQSSPFAGYRNTDIRRVLRDKAHTVCTPGRCDNTIKDDSNEAIKVISFYVDELTDAMNELVECAHG